MVHTITITVQSCNVILGCRMKNILSWIVMKCSWKFWKHTKLLHQLRAPSYLDIHISKSIHVVNLVVEIYTLVNKYCTYTAKSLQLLWYTHSTKSLHCNQQSHYMELFLGSDFVSRNSHWEATAISQFWHDLDNKHPTLTGNLLLKLQGNSKSDFLPYPSVESLM